MPKKDYKLREWPQGVVGLPYHGFSGVWNEISEGDVLTFEREKSNEHDSNAIAVYLKKSVMIFFTDKVKLGYLSKDNNAKYAARMDAGKRLSGIVTECKMVDDCGFIQPKLRVLVEEEFY